jgi:hypothetical protein
VTEQALPLAVRPIVVPVAPGGLPRHGRGCDPAVSDCTWYLLGPFLATVAATVCWLALTEAIVHWPDIHWPWSRRWPWYR